MDLISIALIAGLVVIYTLQSLLTRYYSASYPGREELASPAFTVVSGLIVTCVTFAFAGFRFEASLITVVLGVVNALTIVLYNTALIKASATGPYSITMVFMIAGGIIIPAVATTFFGDDLSIVKILSIAVVLASVYMVARKSNESYTNKKSFFLSCLFLAIGNGAYGTILDVQQRLTRGNAEVSPEKEELIMITYFVGVLISLATLIVREKKGAFKALAQTKKSALFLVGASLVVASAINLMVFALAYMQNHGGTTILYTFDNSLVFLLSVAFSCIFMKEKLSKLNVVGCCTLCAALVTMALSDQIMAFFTSLV
ncbi:MAG: hypothetical protein IJW29_04200 [Clostridia bacterium]|nr:hypothetical protein [Clostridia bacterium]